MPSQQPEARASKSDYIAGKPTKALGLSSELPGAYLPAANRYALPPSEVEAIQGTVASRTEEAGRACVRAQFRNLEIRSLIV